MADAIAIQWTSDSEFFGLVSALVKRHASRAPRCDPDEVLPEVWAGLSREYKDKKFVDANDPMIETVVCRKVRDRKFNLFGGGRCQPKFVSLFSTSFEGVKGSSDDAPDRLAEADEVRAWVEERLSGMAPRKADAVRSVLETPGSSTEAELARRWGTTRQYVNNLARKGREELRRSYERTSEPYGRAQLQTPRGRS